MGTTCGEDGETTNGGSGVAGSNPAVPIRSVTCANVSLTHWCASDASRTSSRARVSSLQERSSTPTSAPVLAPFCSLSRSALSLFIRGRAGSLSSENELITLGSGGRRQQTRAACVGHRSVVGRRYSSACWRAACNDCGAHVLAARRRDHRTCNLVGLAVATSESRAASASARSDGAQRGRELAFEHMRDLRLRTRRTMRNSLVHDV